MTPLPVETLFAEQPDFFAHRLLERPERQNARRGDWVKVVVRLPAGNLKQIWLEVVSTDSARHGAYTGRLADLGYADDLQRILTHDVRFDTQHVYRLLKKQR
jgi:hypothetical protein